MARASAAAGHAALRRLQVRDDVLLIGGRPVTDIARSAGTLPFYAYDSAAIAARVGELRGIFPPGIALHYAVKANPLPELVRFMVTRVDGFDVASVREMQIALDAGMPAEQISFAGPGKTAAEIAAAVRARITLHVESARELAEIIRQGQAAGLRPRIALRVNPDFQLKAAGMRMGGGSAPFGIDAELVPAILQALDNRCVDCSGFHIFAGSQNLSAKAIVEAQNLTLELAEQLAQHATVPVREVNIGGGFGIPYFPGEEPLDTAPIRENLARLAARARKSLPDARLIIELGRYLVGEAGYYVCHVLDRKVSRGRVYLVTDGGLHHHLAASGNFGQVIRKNYPVVIGNRVQGTRRETAWVVGPLCTPLDLLAENMSLAEAGPGDLVVVLQSGAYGFSASPRGFLSHPEPLEIMV